MASRIRRPKSTSGVLAGAMVASAIVGIAAGDSWAATWINATSTTPPTAAQNWNIASNWNPASVPGSGAAVAITNGGVALINTSNATAATVFTGGSGGASGGLYIDNGGTLTLRGTDTNNTGTLRTYTGTATVAAGGSLTIAGGSIAVGGGTFNSAGTVAPTQVVINAGGTYSMTGGSLTTSKGYDEFLMNGLGNFYQSGGMLTVGHQIELGANATYQISGGSVNSSDANAGLYFRGASASAGATIAVVGSGASSINFGGVRYYNANDSANVTWSFTLDNSATHLTPISIGTGTSNGTAGNKVRQGALQVNLDGGVLLSGQKSFTLINAAQGMAGSNFTTGPGPLWSPSPASPGTVQTAVLSTAAGVDKGTLDAGGTKYQTFTASSYGYVDLANISSSATSLDLYLDAQGGTLSNFTNALTTAGITNTSGSYTFGSQSYNVKLTLDPSVSGNSEFAWDLSNVDSSMGIDAVSFFQGSVSHSAVALLTSTDPSASYSAMVGTANPGGTSGSSTITLTGAGSGSYNPGYLNSITENGNKGYVTINGFTPGDAVIAALSLTVDGNAPTSEQLAQLIADLNAGGTGVTASLFSDLASSNPDAYNALKNNDPTWGSDPLEIALLSSGAYTSTNPTYLALDFSNESSLGNVLVTNIAAIPEPAAAGLVGVVAAATLLRRRRKANPLV